MKVENCNLDAWTLHLLSQSAQFFSDNQRHAYLVGGSIRNLLLNEPCTDWDIVTAGDFSTLARQLANTLHGFYAPLHAKACRVVVKHDQKEVVFDISRQHGDTIEDDLHQRDFTINAIAAPLSTIVQALTTNITPDFIDPLSGIADLQARTLRAVNDSVFQHDSLRLLRAVRFMTRYHLAIENTTECMLMRDAPLLTLAAPERIHEELYAILTPFGATERLRFLDNHDLLTTLIPEFIPARGMPQPGLHRWDVLEHSLEAPSSLERLAATLQQTSEEIQRSPLESHDDLSTIRQLLYEAEQQDLFHFAYLAAPPMKLAALLHDIGKTVTYAIDDEDQITFYHHPQQGIPLAQQIMRRLSASTHDRRLVQQVVAHHMRPGQLSADTVTERAIRRYFVDLGPTGISVALVSLADHLAMRGPKPLTASWSRHLATVRLLLTRYIRERERILPPHIIQPQELIRRLNITPGPIVGQLLEHISEAQAEGRVHSKEDALWLAEEMLHQGS